MTTAEMIDIPGTKQRFKDTGRSCNQWARTKGIDPIQFQSRLSGRARFTEKMIEALREDGLLVETEEVPCQ